MRYLGSKNLLVEDIERVVRENVPAARSFCDIFAGTGAVARHFKKHFQIITNDLLHFSYVLQRGTIAINKKPDFAKFIAAIGYSPYEHFKMTPVPEALPGPAFIAENYAPGIKSARQYFSAANALKIDYIRQSLESWKNCGLINIDEYYYLLAGLLEAVPSVANITGTFSAFLKTWDRRACFALELQRLPIRSNRRQNSCFNENANDLIKRISGDILYVDPPYNRRQYAANYHILETISRYDYPVITGATGLRPYKDLFSRYCKKKDAVRVMTELIAAADFKHVIVSYSSEGIMSEDEIACILLDHGIKQSFKIYRFPYRRYKRVAQSVQHSLEELIFHIRKS